MSQDRLDPQRARALRGIPSVDAILRRAEGLEDLPRSAVRREARRWLAECRGSVLAGDLDADAVASAFAEAGIAATLRARCERAAQRRHRPVINATGIVLHTGIGRARLAPAAIDAVADAAGFAIVEVDPHTGQRDEREFGVGGMLKELLGVSGALVVNNNAAAITLTLAAMSAGREAIVSRGEQVEIGGGFRMPSVMQQAGCIMVEVGTTNRTHLADYADAVTEHTGCLLKVHPGNFRIEGFTKMPKMTELVELARKAGTIVIEDLGAGMILDPAVTVAGLSTEPRVQQSVADGVDLITFSGDKLLGGPQCGVIVGDRELVARVRAHPLYRAFRCDKVALAALEATLQIYRDGDPLQEIPTLRMLSADVGELKDRAITLAGLLADLGAQVVASDSFAGSGANPAQPIPSHAVALPGGDAVNDRLRQGPAGIVFARVAQDRVLLDQRTLLLEELDDVAARIRTNLGS